ncbi:MAG TPA: protease HtpX [Myxococcota bacterium]|jgi:heat shock protein HtpX
MKRVLLFVATNLAVMLVAGVAMQLLGVPQMLASRGLPVRLEGLLIMSALFGMGGSFFSLAISKWIAKRSVGAVVITEPRNQSEQWLLQTVSRQAQAAGIGMPEVAIYDDPTPNAFATGARRDSALVAVSTGLLRGMTQDEVEGVLGHEVSHIANGDMVTLTLIQGVLNTFVLFFSYVVGMIVDSFLRRGENDRGPGIGSFVARMAAQLVFGLLASLIVMWFSRQREFRADAGSARLSSPGKMIGALQRLASRETAPLPQSLAAFGISTGKHGSRLFMTHPPLEERIERLRSNAGLSQ